MARNRDRDDDEDDTPKKSKKKKAPPKSNKTLLFAALGGGTVLLLGCCTVGGILGVVYWPGRGPAGPGGGGGGILGGGNAAVTQANWKKITAAMTRKEVEDVVGGAGENISLAQADVLVAKFDPREKRQFPREISGFPGHTVTVWRSGSNHILVGFVPSKKYGDLAAYSDLYIDRGEGTTDGGTMFETPGAVEKTRDKIEKDRQFLADPKWKKGAAARKALVGAWGNNPRAPFDYEFRENGTMIALVGLANKSVSGTYRFLDDERIETRVPGQMVLGQKRDSFTRKFLVSDTDLCLFELLDNGAWSSKFQYRRQQ